MVGLGNIWVAKEEEWLKAKRKEIYGKQDIGRYKMVLVSKEAWVADE
jgi:hypothetical protein